MLRKIAAAGILCSALLLTACGTAEQDVMQLGIPAVITEKDTENQTIQVQDTEGQSLFGESRKIDCAGVPIVYCDNRTGQVQGLEFVDLQVGDELLLGISQPHLAELSDEVCSVQVEQIQLVTQRME